MTRKFDISEERKKKKKKNNGIALVLWCVNKMSRTRFYIDGLI